MTMIKALIIDDEPRSLKALKSTLEEFCPEVFIAGSAGNIDKARELIDRTAPELIFLDIEMPYGNAFDLLNSLGALPFETIFVTAFNQYALKAFKYNAIDYLLKPVVGSELKDAVARAAIRLKARQVNENLHTFLQQFRNGHHQQKKIVLPSLDGLLFTDAEDIVRCEADGSYSRFHLSSREKILVSRNLRECEDILPADQFYRVHHSHIVNLRYIKKYFRGRGGYVELTDGAHVEVSANKKDGFLALFEK